MKFLYVCLSPFYVVYFLELNKPHRIKYCSDEFILWIIRHSLWINYCSIHSFLINFDYLVLDFWVWPFIFIKCKLNFVMNCCLIKLAASIAIEEVWNMDNSFLSSEVMDWRNETIFNATCHFCNYVFRFFLPYV